MHSYILCGAVAIAFLACGGEAPIPSANQRDSIGITIVESAAPRWGVGQGWAVSPEPILNLATTGTGPPYEFFRVRDATLLPAGVIAVASAGSNDIRFFSSTGEFLYDVGGEGEGPGEFQWLESIQEYRGDSLVAFDQRLRRMTVFSPTQKVSRTITLLDLPVREVEPLDDGTFAARFFYASMDLYEGESGVLVRVPNPIVRLSSSGEVVDTIAMGAGYEEFIAERGATVPLFGKDSHFAVHNGQVYLGDADQMEFEVFSETGQLRRIVRVAGMEFGITPQDMEDERDGRLGPDPSPSRLDAFAELPVPETKPAYSSFLVDSEGCIWAEEYRHNWLSLRSSRSRNWSVFGPNGVWLGTVAFPAPFAVYEIGSDYVLGLGRDEMGVEHVQMLTLNRN